MSIKTLIAFIGTVGGAAGLALFPAGTEVFAAYALGLALGFFLNPLEHGVRLMFSSVRSEQRRRNKKQQAKKLKAEKDIQEEFAFAGQYIDKNIDSIVLVVAQKFRENPSRCVDAADLWEFPVGVVTKLQILRFFATAFPEWFFLDFVSLRMRKQAVKDGNPFLEDPSALRSIMRSKKTPPVFDDSNSAS